MSAILTRRNVLGGALLLPTAPMTWAAPRTRKYGIYPRFTGPHYTATTAPGATARRLLTNKVKSLNGLRSAERFDYGVHASFARIMEQNFARLDPQRMEHYLRMLTPLEWRSIAQLYANAGADWNRRGLLLDVMAEQMQPAHLVAVSRYFGFQPVYDAVARLSPAKLHAFEASSSPSFAAPVAYSNMGGRGATTNGIEQYIRWLDYTPEQIYLDFRTAPKGALGVTSSLVMTSAVMYGAASLSYGFSHYATTNLVVPLLRTYAPGLWETIGGTLNEIVERWERLRRAAPTPEKEKQAMGDFERELAGPACYDVGPTYYEGFENYGGDYGSLSAMEFTEPSLDFRGGYGGQHGGGGVLGEDYEDWD